MSLAINLSDVPKLLLHINNEDRDTWFKVGNALKTEFGEQAFSYWDDWSSTSKSYVKRDAKSVWDSLSIGKNTMGTIIYLAQQTGWKPEKQDLTPEQKRKIKEEQEARRAAREAEIEADQAKKEIMQKVVAKGCQKVWENYGIEFGHSGYLKHKQITALGIRYFHQTVLLWIDDLEEKVGVISGAKVFEFFKKLPKPKPENLHFLMFKKGSIAVPLRDTEGKIWSLQYISSTGVKLFPKFGRKVGLFHVIGYLKDAKVIAQAEGYATAASIHMATEWPVVVSFDCGNMVNVAPFIRQQAPDAKILMCGDNDDNGAGQAKALEAAMLIGADVVIPDFGTINK
ncbi:PriCT-2 domain-containing protein [Agitococcus lubricus]|uniref:Putative DNA primase/helicase n=1 Tax=Agitococcus lubricus TaxID=1077255 RepID=A0A2T5J0H9_9GAMM|nr:PriCT-2 domain-containing protein [Agitococcus lubricus]PTQ89815.1 putative DNA primase/helicase [Agitococcus lubricus]